MAGGAIMAYARKNKKQRVSEAAVGYAEAVATTTSGQHEYLSLLGLRSFDTAALLKRLEEGLSFAAFERLKRRLSVSSQELADAALITQRTLARRKRTGRLGPDESDRLVRVSRVFARSIELFEGDVESARSWLMRPVLALGGAVPFEMVKTEVGAREVENLITRLEHGVFS
jgi:putative toxin-antitoxin system antitoxin component (TIGR02293 family)